MSDYFSIYIPSLSLSLSPYSHLNCTNLLNFFSLMNSLLIIFSYIYLKNKIKKKQTTENDETSLNFLISRWIYRSFACNLEYPQNFTSKPNKQLDCFNHRWNHNFNCKIRPDCWLIVKRMLQRYAVVETSQIEYEMAINYAMCTGTRFRLILNTNPNKK